ncbi:MAG: hypothetical protein WDN72_09550 [Alphaproteobacteria bacterium]
MQKLVFSIGLALFVGLIAFALYTAGTPAHVRRLKQDYNKLEYLSCLTCQAQQYGREHGKLPEDKAELAAYVKTQSQSHGWCSNGEFHCDSGIRDLIGQGTATEKAMVYDYRKDDKGGQLCTEFAEDYAAQKKQEFSNRIPTAFENYAAGRQCFPVTLLPCPERDHPCRK